MGNVITAGSFAPFLGPIDDSLGTNFGGRNSTDRALSAQRQSAADAQVSLKEGVDLANQIGQRAYDQQRADISPYTTQGGYALSQLGSGNFASNLQMDPGYQFRMQEGQKSLENSAAARGLLNSGRTMKELTRYGQDFASNEYANAYNREYNRLSNLANLGFAGTQSLMGATQNYGNTLGQNYMQYGLGSSNIHMGLGNAEASARIAQADRSSNLMGQGLLAGGMFAASDQRVKENIRPVSKEDLDELRSVIKPYHFTYVNEAHGKGEWVGVMAQDLEKSKLGRTVVFEEKGVKKIDMLKLMSLLVASMAKEAA